MRNKANTVLSWMTATCLAAQAGMSVGGAWAGSEIEARQRAERPIEWRAPQQEDKTVAVTLLAINDFHSQITAGLEVAGRPVGSAPVLAAYLKAAQARARGQTFILHAGDHVGASQPRSALLQDEPGIMVFNMLGNQHCRPGGLYGVECNLIGIPGNHELDEGMGEMLRLIHGGNHRQGPYLQDPYQGAHFPYICANLVRTATNKPLFPPSVVRMVDGVPIGFVGALLRHATTFLPPDSLDGLQVLDEAEAINAQVAALRAEGVHAVVAVIHQGGYQLPANGSEHPSTRLAGDLAAIVGRLDGEVDVVLAGHTHTVHNLLVDNAAGRKTLVTQAWPKGTGYAEIDLEISRTGREVVALSSRIVTTWADQGPGLRPDVRVARLADRVDAMGNAVAAQVIANAAKPITRVSNEAGESALGDLVADAQRQAMGTDFAFMHPEGIEADIDPGHITKGDYYTVQPANLNLVKLEMTGEQIYALLNQQWTTASGEGRFLQVSGLSYVWDAHRPAGRRVVSVMKDGEPLRRGARYTVTVNEYLAAGGGNFTVLTEAANPVVGPFIADALHQYVRTRPQPINAAIEGRISRLN
ncbi:5'-Nucleotidase domain-containing protein [Desulfobulbus propionicus DSM 2032]|uniref:5'-Nucleotidase domain-containing protein n=2 Tax=Desulfobulbus propionicus TaxID=894 RepID=A0A7U3YL29_DESPD|nr:5'-Nucleotidase domain-containing protein [Desulfobulbus propionicus DSM 2032]